MYLKKFVSELVVSRHFPLSNYIDNYWNSIVLTVNRMKPPNFVKYVLIGCNLFLKLPRQIKGFRVMIYNQVLISENEEMKKDSKFE